MKGWRSGVLTLGLLAAASAAQEIQLGGTGLGSSARKQHVELINAPLRVKAGVPQWVALHFQVDPGYHINSHTPHDELLIPTAFTSETVPPLKIVTERYPPGVPLRLDVGDGQTLSTYQGEFRVELEVVAARGESALNGALRYQACDAHACFPPRSLPVRATLTAE